MGRNVAKEFFQRLAWDNDRTQQMLREYLRFLLSGEVVLRDCAIARIGDLVILDFGLEKEDRKVEHHKEWSMKLLCRSERTLNEYLQQEIKIALMSLGSVDAARK